MIRAAFRPAGTSYDALYATPKCQPEGVSIPMAVHIYSGMHATMVNLLVLAGASKL